jgi:hypothetical protein
MTYHGSFNQIDTAGATSGAGTVYLSFSSAIVLSGLQYTDSDYTFGIFKLFLKTPKW